MVCNAPRTLTPSRRWLHYIQPPNCCWVAVKLRNNVALTRTTTWTKGDSCMKTYRLLRQQVEVAVSCLLCKGAPCDQCLSLMNEIGSSLMRIGQLLSSGSQLSDPETQSSRRFYVGAIFTNMLDPKPLIPE